MSAGATPAPNSGVGRDDGVDGRALAAFAGCCLIWGSTFLVIRIGNDALPPLWAAGLRLLLATIIFAAIALLTRRPLPRGAALRSAAAFGFLNFGVGISLLYWGEASVSSGITAIVFGTIPFTTAIAARALGLERVSTPKLLATLVAIAGVAAIFSSELGRSVPMPGLLAVLASSVCASLSGAVLKRGPRQHPIGVNAVAAPVGSAVCLLASAWQREPHPLPLEPAAWVPIVYLALAGSVGAFTMYNWLVNRWPVTRTSLVAVIVPVVATLLGAVVRHEHLTRGSALGAALVFVALLIVAWADRRASAAA